MIQQSPLVLCTFLSRDLKNNPEYKPLRNVLKEHFADRLFNVDLKYIFTNYMHETDKTALQKEGFDVSDMERHSVKTPNYVHHLTDI